MSQLLGTHFFSENSINFNFILSNFSLGSGCLLSSLPSDATNDKTSTIGFVCDLNDNIAAPWPSNSSVPAFTCNKSMDEMLNFPCQLNLIYFFYIESFSCTIIVPSQPTSNLLIVPFSLPPFINLFPDLMELQLPLFQHSQQQHLHKVVSGLEQVSLFFFLKVVFIFLHCRRCIFFPRFCQNLSRITRYGSLFNSQQLSITPQLIGIGHIISFTRYNVTIKLNWKVISYISSSYYLAENFISLA